MHPGCLSYRYTVFTHDDWLPTMFVTPAIHLCQLIVECTVSYQLFVLVVQQERCACVLNGVVRGPLDVDADEVRSEEA